MAHRNGPSIWIDKISIIRNSQSPQCGQRLRSKGFVQLDLAKESDLAMDLAMVPAVLLSSLLARIPRRIRIPLIQVRTAGDAMQVWVLNF